MKYIRHSLAAGALTLVLALPAVAGHMHTPVTSPPPPSTTGHMDTTSMVAATGEMPYPVIASLDPVTEIMLNLVHSALSLF